MPDPTFQARPQDTVRENIHKGAELNISFILMNVLAVTIASYGWFANKSGRHHRRHDCCHAPGTNRRGRFVYGEMHLLALGALLLTFTSMVAIQFASSVLLWHTCFRRLSSNLGCPYCYF